MTRTQSLRKKMQFSFLTVSAVSIIIVITFSLSYFYFAVRSQATQNMREKLEIAELIYDTRMDSVHIFSQNLAANNALQVLLDLDIRNKLSELVVEVVNQEKVYQIIVFDENYNVYANVGAKDHPLIENDEISPIGRNLFALEAMMGGSPFGTESVRTNEAVFLSISSAEPVYRDGKIVGGVLVRLVLNGNREVVGEIADHLNVEAAIIEAGVAVASTATIDMDANLYKKMITGTEIQDGMQYFETISFWFGGVLSEYRTLTDLKGTPVGVLAIQDSAAPFVQTFLNALYIFLAIMAAALALAVFFVYLISRGIIVPINELLQGVNKITDGDLTHEIVTSLSDEIGKLSTAFNDMRVALNEKISTIQEMNEGLEETVKERTGTIESLLESMKKYLPMQLFDAIVHGQRDNDINAHYRKKLTVFFSDIVNFTPTAESMEAEDLSDLLNSYLDNMAKIALKWGGTIDKFIGDAVMIFFGDPEATNDADHALRAVRMSLEMLTKMHELRKEWTNRGVQQPLHIRIGINTGYCTVGNFGSENRMDYTIIGGNVNLAQRLESGASPDSILISHETYSLIKSQIDCEYVEELTLKGISHAVMAYRVLGEKDSAEESLEMVALQPNGIALKESLIDPSTLRPGERKELIESLTMALNFAKGKLRYVYDEHVKSWKLIESESDKDA